MFPVAQLLTPKINYRKLGNVNTETIKGLEIDHTKLVDARKEKGFTQAEVARNLGFDRRQVWQFERGTALTLENFTKLMLFYGKPIEFYLKTQ